MTKFMNCYFLLLNDNFNSLFMAILDFNEKVVSRKSYLCDYFFNENLKILKVPFVISIEMRKKYFYKSANGSEDNISKAFSKSSHFDRSTNSPDPNSSHSFLSQDLFLPQLISKNTNKYSIEELRALEPQDDSATDYPLNSNGYFSLLSLQNNLPVSQINSPKLRNKYNSSKSVLVEHTQDRYASTRIQKELGLYDENSLEAKQSNIRKCLNRLSSINIQTIKDEINKIPLDPSPLAELFIERFATDGDKPETNPHFKNLSSLAKALSDTPERSIAFKESALSSFHSLHNNSKTKITVMEGIIVWLSYLFQIGILNRNEFFSTLDLVKSSKTNKTNIEIERAVILIRTALFIFGEFADQKGYTETATFYMFLKFHKTKKGYIDFAIDDLLEMRNNNWKFISKTNKNAKLPQKSKNEYDDIDLMDNLETTYISYKASKSNDNNNNDNNINNNAPILLSHKPNFSHLCRILFKILPKHFKDSIEFCEFFSQVIKSSNALEKEIISEYQLGIRNFAETYDLDSPQLWNLIIYVFGFSYSNKILTFEKIVQTYYDVSVPSQFMKPSLSEFFIILGQIQNISAKECLNILNILSGKGLFTLASSASLACLVDYDDIMDYRENNSILKNAVNDSFLDFLDIRSLVYDTFCDFSDDIDIKSQIQPIQNNLIEIYKKYNESINIVLKNTLIECNLPLNLRKKIEQFFFQNIFYK